MSEATGDGWQQTDTFQAGHASLPNGLGLRHPDDEGKTVLTGVPANELTASEDRDWLAGRRGTSMCAPASKPSTRSTRS